MKPSIHSYTLNFLFACLLAVFVPVALSSCGDSGIVEVPPTDPPGNGGGDGNGDADGDDETVTLRLADLLATPQTKALYSNLWNIAKSGTMFGHHDDLWYGRYWYGDEGGSDTKAVCGDYPAVFSVDFAPIMDERALTDLQENELRRRAVLQACARGEVITACSHLNNPLTGGDSWDNSNNTVVKEILTDDSPTRTLYISWLDRLADFALDLKDADGECIPVLFRPFHEHTQNWSWWGTSCTTEQEFIDLWRMTVEYLRDNRGVHNFIYAISPQMDSEYNDTKGRLLTRWPGDRYVDFIGMDCYHGLNSSAFASNLKHLSQLARQKLKPSGVTETGQESFTATNYWTRYIMDPLEGEFISMVVMWRNKYVGDNEWDKHYYSVYPGHPSEDDFRSMYASGRIFFSSTLPDMYVMAEGVEVE